MTPSKPSSAGPAEPRPMTRFRLPGRPAIVFEVVRFYQAGGFVPSVKGVSLDGAKETCARVVDVIKADEPPG